jgi:uncharacterized membrane protein
MVLPRYVAGGILLVILAFSFFVYPALPSRIPIHFAFDGVPNGWADRSVWTWLMMPGIGLAIWGLMELIGHWIVSNPDNINVPNKDKYLALPSDRKREVAENVRVVLLWQVVALLVLFGAIQYSIYLASISPVIGERVNETIGLSVLVLVPIGAIVLIVKLTRMIDRVSSRAH